MKNFFVAGGMIACLSFANGLKAQDVKEEIIEKKEGKELKEKKKTQEIIIRQNNDKDVTLKLEINGDKVTVNGKPLSEFKDKDITINKRKLTITDGNHIFKFDAGDMAPGTFNFNHNMDDVFIKGFNGDEGDDRPFLGVTTETADGGVKINEVIKGSAAEKAGLKTGDIITKIADDKITSPETLSEIVGDKKPKDEIKITYKRDGKENTAKAALGTRAIERVKTFRFNGAQPRARVQQFGNAAPFTNMEGYNDILSEMEPAMYLFRKKIGLKIQDTEDGGNVKVINVEDSSAAATAGMKKDDLITEINGKKIENTDDAREELMPDEEKRSYKIKALRNGVEMSFDVKIPRKLKTANL